MGVFIKKLILGIIILSIFLVSGCAQKQNAVTPEQEKITQLTVKYKDSSTFLLSLAELPQENNWTIAERGERNINDVDSNALEYNWSGGYYINFKSSQKDEITYLGQSLSIYPENKILGILNTDFQGEEPLSNPFIGENSRAVKTRTTVFGREIIAYRITFVKNNVLVNLISSGTGTDYLKLKELAQKAYDKVNGYGKPFDYQTLKPTSKTYTNNLYKFSMIQPNRWNTNDNSKNIVQFDSPIVSGKSASILVSIFDSNISFFDTDTNRKIFIDSLKRDVSNFVLIESNSMTINNKKAYSFTYVNTIATGENRAAQQVYVERNENQVFLVAYVSDSKQFETYHNVFTNTLNSFTSS